MEKLLQENRKIKAGGLFASGGMGIENGTCFPESGTSFVHALRDLGELREHVTRPALLDIRN